MQLSKGGAEVPAKVRGLLLVTLFFSVFTNLLMLTGPLFMLQVYDRVLASRSEETLVALFALVAEGAIDATPRHRYALADAADCHRDLEARATAGSIVLTP